MKMALLLIFCQKLTSEIMVGMSGVIIVKEWEKG